jgi:hypothetical protein
MRRFIASTFNSLASSTAPERPLESPNRITRLIANRREKLMRLAALEAGSQFMNSTVNASLSTKTIATTSMVTSISTMSASKTTVTLMQDTESGTASESEINNLACNNKNKTNRIMPKSKTIKKKHSSRLLAVRNRTRRKLRNIKEDNDTEQDDESQEYMNTYVSNILF